MSVSRAGHHGDVGFVFEDNGFDTDPADTSIKPFGSNATLDTFDGSREAVRVFNTDRVAADIVRQVFDGAWSVTHQLSEPLWYVAGILGQPVTTEVMTGLYEHVYSIGNGNDPVSLRLYLPTEGFSEYEIIPGAVPTTVDIDQSQPGNPELTVSGAYAREPERDTTLDVSVPSLSEETYTNRDGEVRIDTDTVAKAQTSTVTLESNTEMVGEIGSDQSVDFRTGAFEPDPTVEKVIATDQTVDPLQRFLDANQVEFILSYDNGQTGTDEYSTAFNIKDSYPNQWSEAGRNDPDADLTEELQELGQDAEVVITNDQANPPGV